MMRMRRQTDTQLPIRINFCGRYGQKMRDFHFRPSIHTSQYYKPQQLGLAHPEMKIWSSIPPVTNPTVKHKMRWSSAALLFSIEKAILWINDSYFSRKQRFEVKNVLVMDLFQLLSSPDVNWWTGVVWITCGLLWCFYQLFGLSFWRHPFTAKHPLLRHWCRDTFLQTWSRNKLILILDGLRVSTFSANFHFWVNWWLVFMCQWIQHFNDWENNLTHQH